MIPEHLQRLREIEKIDFSGRGETFVQDRFITPLLSCLGYETHKDYEVKRHGDDGASFRLNYPPVERGAARVKYYSPDYAPTIRKKMFWVIEAKAPKIEDAEKAPRYVVQGLQYCIHPEIQAKYLLVTNGQKSALYNAFGAVFFGEDPYDPVLTFSATELIARWPEIFGLLSVETLRAKIEDDLKAMYDKLCLSSLDRHYPDQLLRKIGRSAYQNAEQIEAHVWKLYGEKMDDEASQRIEALKSFTADQLYSMMNLPLGPGNQSEAYYYINKALAERRSEDQIFSSLTDAFMRHSIFWQLQAWHGLCCLYHRTGRQEIRDNIIEFFSSYADVDLPILTQAECALLRFSYKFQVVALYEPTSKALQAALAKAPEIDRYVRPPTAIDQIYTATLMANRIFFNDLVRVPEAELPSLLAHYLAQEAKIEESYEKINASLPRNERHICGVDTYGINGRHYAFKNILQSCNIKLPEQK